MSELDPKTLKAASNQVLSHIAGMTGLDGMLRAIAHEIQGLAGIPGAEKGEEAVELGPDGKKWAKTEAGYAHVNSIVSESIEGPAGIVWYGHAVREAFVAGAEWQERRFSALETINHLRDALLPFAEHADQIESGFTKALPDEYVTPHAPTLGTFRRARSILRQVYAAPTSERVTGVA